METELKRFVEESDRILITSHIGPDGDAVASSLLLLGVLLANYPDKTVSVSLEEQPFGLGFLDDSDKIEIQPLAAAIERHKPQLLFVLDANTVSRLTRRPDAAREALSQTDSKLVIIDHHEPEGIEPNDLYVNNHSPAVTLDIYELFIKQMSLKKPHGYAQTAMTGIYTDTGGFINRNMSFDKTFEVVPELIKDGANIELIASRLKQISAGGAKVFIELMNNMKLEDEFTYSYISDETAGNRDNLEAVRQAADLFRSEIIRDIEGRPWGFLVYKDCLAADGNTYSASFRALAGSKDVSLFAAALGGGGHKPTAGAKFPAENLDDALNKVRSVVAQHQ